MPVTYVKNLGYNATGIGAREFDGGATVFQNLISGYNPSPYTNYYASTPLSMNINTTASSTGYTPLLKVKTFTIDGVEIAVAAITNFNTASLTKLPSDLSIMSGANTAAQLTQNLATKKIVILLSKQSTLAEERTFIDTYGLSSFVDIIVSSNNGEAMIGKAGCSKGFTCTQTYPLNMTNSQGNTYLYVIPPPLGTGIGVLNVTFDSDGILSSFSGDAVLFNRSLITPDPTVAEDLSIRQAFVTSQTSKVVASSPVFLVGDGTDFGPCRTRQCSMGSLVADAMRNYSGADYAFLSGGTLRSNISIGDISYGSILTVLPFSNTLATFDVTGTTLLAMLNNAFSAVVTTGAKSGGRFPQISGLRVTYNPALVATARVINIEVYNPTTGGYDAFDTRNTYSVATLDYNYAGGDGYSSVLPSQAINAVPFGAPLVDMVVNWINTQNTAGASGTSYFNSLVSSTTRLVTTGQTQAFTPTSRPIVAKTIPDGLVIAFTVITGVIAIVAILIGAFIWYNRQHAVTVIASPVFCLIIIFGVLLSLLALMVYMHILNDAGCMAFPWLANYAFVIIFGSLFAKTWRIDMIFSSTKKLKTKRRAIPPYMLGAVIGILLLIDTFIMGLWQGLSPLKYTNHINNDNYTSQNYCASKNGVYFFAAAVAYKGLLMLWGMYLVIKTRNIDSDFRESTFIGWVIFAVFFTVAVIVVICLILKTTMVAVFVLIHIGFWIVSFAVIGAIFIPKIIEIISHPGLVWSVYFQRRAENLRNGTGSVFAKNTSVSQDSIHDRMDGMSVPGLHSLLEEYELRQKSLQSSLKQVDKDLVSIRAKIAKKEGSGGSTPPPPGKATRKK